MYSLFKWLMPLGLLGMSFAEGDDKGGGGEGDKGGDKGSEGKDWKVEFDKLSGDNTKLKGDLEDMRMEVLSPEYIEFLNAKDTKPTKPEEKPAGDKGALSDDAFEKLSKKELFQKAQEAAEKKMESKVEDIKKTYASDKEARKNAEIATFASTHADFEQYRPTMYGLSVDPKNKNMSLTQLYSEAKAVVQRIHTGTSEEEKKKQKKMGNEKPGGSNDSYEHLKGLTPTAAAKEAFEDTKKELGIDAFPLA